VNEVRHEHWQTPSGLWRARALAIPLEGVPGPFNAITDVAGIEVGYCTLIRGEGSLSVGHGPVRTGVTAILPRGHEGLTTPVFAGCHVLNGTGELTGTLWVEEVGRCDGPITLTNTYSCGTARDASIKWVVNQRGITNTYVMPVAGETYDGWLNDIQGFHVGEQHVFEALDSARTGPIEEGSVGGGTGMICYGFKGGSGTASRLIACGDAQFVVGVFVQANFGRREQLTIAGVPVGRHLSLEPSQGEDKGSIIAIVATDMPLLPHQLKRVARRVSLGVGRSGTISGYGSGDIFMAFSTANPEAFRQDGPLAIAHFVPNDQLNVIFGAVVEATDEAILNALVANQTMVGVASRTVAALPHDDVEALIKRFRPLES
jgi:L-aminopeptidase/D-esterase-like protein